MQLTWTLPLAALLATDSALATMTRAECATKVCFYDAPEGTAGSNALCQAAWDDNSVTLDLYENWPTKHNVAYLSVGVCFWG